MTAAPSSQAGLASIVGGIGSAPRVGAERVQVRTEWGVRFSDGMVETRESVVEAQRTIAFWDGATLVSRRVEVHPWRAEIVAPESGGSDRG